MENVINSALITFSSFGSRIQPESSLRIFVHNPRMLFHDSIAADASNDSNSDYRRLQVHL